MTTVLQAESSPRPARGPHPSRFPSAAVAPSPTSTLRIEPWIDALVDEIGHDPRSSYVEQFWLPVLGPSTVLLLRRFASHLDDAPYGADVRVEELARRLGIGERFGPNAPLARTLKRCVDFQMAEWRGARLAVRRRLPPLTRRHLRRLPDSLQHEHDELTGERNPFRPVPDRLRSHGRRLALSLIEFGDDEAAAEARLVRWGFDPGLAASSARFAGLELARREAARAAHPTASRAAVRAPAMQVRSRQ